MHRVTGYQQFTLKAGRNLQIRVEPGAKVECQLLGKFGRQGEHVLNTYGYPTPKDMSATHEIKASDVDRLFAVRVSRGAASYDAWPKQE